MAESTRAKKTIFLKAKDDRILQDKSDRILEGNTAKSSKEKTTES
jgi:hypothetical protein